jgi:hypothetical protein
VPWAHCAAEDGRLGRAMRKTLDSKVIMRLLGEVQAAASVFEGRWTLGALARVDAELAQRMADQIADYQEAMVTGTIADVKEHVAGMKRGYNKCARVCEAAGVEDDAYLLGLDSMTGMRVAIGDRKASGPRVAELHGDRVTWLTPDECAKLWASIEGLRRVDAIKSAFAGAEVRDFRPHTREWAAGPHSGEWPSVAEVMPAPPDEGQQEDEE